MTLVSSTLGIRRVLRSLPNRAESGEVEHVSLVRPNHQADVRHHQEQTDVQKGPRALRDRGASQHQAHQIRAQNAQNRANRRPDQAAQAGALQPNLEQKNGNSKCQAHACRNII
jgi:hypothetical protein